VAKAAVTDDPLGSFLALLEVATGLARRHGCGCVVVVRSGGIDGWSGFSWRAED
jgi:hypothetical protein